MPQSRKGEGCAVGREWEKKNWFTKIPGLGLRNNDHKRFESTNIKAMSLDLTRIGDISTRTPEKCNK